MATRRRSSAGAGKRRAGASARSTRARDAREGRTTIPCPACGTEYRIPLEMLEEQISCKSCGRAFVPKNASRRRIRSQNPAQPFIVGGAVLAFMVIGYFLVSSRGSDAGQQQTRRDTPRQVETGERNPRVRDVADWVAALASGNRFKLGTNSDVAALAKFFDVGLVDGSAEDRERVVVDRLLSDPKTAVMRDAYVTSARVDESDAEATEGTVHVDLAIQSEAAKKYAQPSAKYEIRFRYTDGRGRVTGFEALYEPPLRQPEKPKGPRPVKHEILGLAEDVEREYGGQKEVVREAELKPLPHLEGTSEELRKEIDDSIRQLTDIDAGGLVTNRAARRLKEIGKPAVPRLLNQLYELVVGQGPEASLQDQDTVLRIRKVAMALEDLTGQRFGFNPSVIESQTTSDEYRLSSLKQWYGWWADNHWRDDFDYAIDKSEDLFGEPANPDKTSRGGR